MFISLLLQNVNMQTVCNLKPRTLAKRWYFLDYKVEPAFQAEPNFGVKLQLLVRFYL